MDVKTWFASNQPVQQQEKTKKKKTRIIINFCTITRFRLCGTINGANTRQVNHVVEWSRVACSQAYRFEFLPWTRANLRYIYIYVTARQLLVPPLWGKWAMPIEPQYPTIFSNNTISRRISGKISNLRFEKVC